MDDFYNYLSSITGIGVTYIYLVFNSILVISIFILIKRFIEYLIRRRVPLLKQYSANQFAQIIINIIMFIMLFFVWDNYVKSLITLISILGASFIVALRECVLSFFAGIHIRIKRPFITGDRIEVDGVKGDVMSISSFDFDILEIDNTTDKGQSTGVMISLPNSYVFTKNIKNYTKGFKYVWNELTVNVDLKCDLAKNKKELYRIVNNVDNIKYIINKMKNQSEVVGTNNNIYFNKYDPIIYTKIVSDHVELTIRYLVDPKKSRVVESIIWNKLYESYKKKDIDLYIVK